MKRNSGNKEPKEYSSEELDLALYLDFCPAPFTLRSLAKAACQPEEQVRQALSKMRLLQVVSRERVAECKRIHALAMEAYAALARAAQEHR